MRCPAAVALHISGQAAAQDCVLPCCFAAHRAKCASPTTSTSGSARQPYHSNATAAMWLSFLPAATAPWSCAELPQLSSAEGASSCTPLFEALRHHWTLPGLCSMSAGVSFSCSLTVTAARCPWRSMAVLYLYDVMINRPGMLRHACRVTAAMLGFECFIAASAGRCHCKQLMQQQTFDALLCCSNCC
jgi:hypothetical protein